MAKSICNNQGELETSYFLIIQLSLVPIFIDIVTVVELFFARCLCDVTNAFSQSVLFRVPEGVNIVSGFLLKVVILFLAALVK